MNRSAFKNRAAEEVAKEIQEMEKLEKDLQNETTENVGTPTTKWYGTVKDCKRLRVRDYPNESSTVIGYLPVGTRVELTVAEFGQTPEKFTWHRMKNVTPAGIEGVKVAGYIMGKFLDIEVVEE